MVILIQITLFVFLITCSKSKKQDGLSEALVSSYWIGIDITLDLIIATKVNILGRFVCLWLVFFKGY